MEVKMNWKGLFLLAALFGAAGMASGQEAETVVTTDTVPVTTEVVPTEGANNYNGVDAGYIAPAPGFGGINVNGYFNGGGIFNTHGVDYNMVSIDSDNKLNVNGAYLAAVKEAQTGCGMMDWGFGADVMFGRTPGSSLATPDGIASGRRGNAPLIITGSISMTRIGRVMALRCRNSIPRCR